MRTPRFRNAAAGIVRSLAAATIAAAALSCGERPTAGPGIPSPVSLSVAPVFESPVADGPVIVLDRVAGWLVPIPEADSVFAEAAFDGGEAALGFDVLVAGAEQRFVFRLDAFDAREERVFASTDTIEVRAGEDALVDGIALEYVARDAGITTFTIEASRLALAVGDTVHLNARGCCAEAQQLFAVNAGWRSRDPLVAAVERATGVVSAIAPGRAWMVATLFNGTVDSTEVVVGGGIETVTIETASPTLGAIGATASLAATARDATGAPVEAPIAWRSLAPGVATVDPATGDVTAAANGVAPIVAEAAGKADTLDVVVAQVATSLGAAADEVELNAIGDATRIVAVARDANGHPVPDLAIAFAPLPELGAGRVDLSVPLREAGGTGSPLLAVVQEEGATVVARASQVGEAWVEASAEPSAGGRIADSVRIVVRQIAATVAIDPATLTLLPGETASLGLEVRDSAGVLVPQPAASWVSSATTVATVDGAGGVGAVETGRATITATVDGVSGTATVDVLAQPPLARTWIGGDAAAPGDWMNGANWSPAGVPAPGDTVVVPATASSPALLVDATVATLSVEAGAALQVDRTLTVAGSVTGTLTGPGTVRIAGAAGDSVAGSFPSLIVASSVRAGGDVRTAGQLLVSGLGRLRPAGHTISVGGALGVTGGGMLVMVTPGDSVDVQGRVDFAAGDSRGALETGVLVVRGDFQAKGLDAFHAGTGLRVVFAGQKAPQLVAMDSPGADAQHFADVVVANETAGGVRFATVWIAGSLRDGQLRPALAIFEGGESRIDGGVVLMLTGGEIGGTGTLSVAGDVEALSSSVSVSVLRLGGSKGTTMIGALGTGHATLELPGKAQPLRSGLAYRNVRVTGSASLVGPEAVTFDGSLRIEGDAAELAPAGTALLVTGDLVTSLRGVLALRNDKDDVTVKGAVTIDGGPTGAALLYGTLRVGRDFAVVCKTAECFAPSASGNLTVQFDGSEKQTVSLTMPGAPGQGGALQQFRHVRVSNRSGVIFATGTPVMGSLSVDAAALMIVPEGAWVDVAGLLFVERSGTSPGKIDNFGELFAGEDDSGGTVSPNPVQPRK